MARERSLTGKIVKLTNSGAYLYEKPFGKKVLSNPLTDKGSLVGLATGEVKNYKDSKNKSFRFIKVWTLNKNYKQVQAWIDSAYCQESEATSEENGDLLLKSIMIRDQYTYLNLLQSFKYFVALQKAKKPIPKQEFANMVKIYVSLMERQKRIRENEDIKTKTGFPAKMASIRNSWEKTLENALSEKTSGIGIIPIVVIIIVVIVSAGATLAVYQLFKPDYEDSKSDFVLSDDLEEKLKKYLPADVYQQLKNEGEENVDDAYNAGKSKQKFKDFWNLAKYPVLLIGGFWLGDKFITAQSKKRA